MSECEPHCECCQVIAQFKEDLDKHFSRVVIDVHYDFSYGEVIEITGPVVCNDGTKFEDYSWEQYLKYLRYLNFLGYGIPKDE